MDGQHPRLPDDEQPAVLEYRPGGPESNSQWWTDDEAYGKCLVLGLLVLTAAGAVIGCVGWIVWTFLGF